MKKLFIIFSIALMIAMVYSQNTTEPVVEPPAQPQPHDTGYECREPEPGLTAFGFCQNINYPISSRWNKQDFENMRNSLNEFDARFNFSIGQIVDNVAQFIDSSNNNNICFRAIHDLVCSSIFRRCALGERIVSNSLWAGGYPPCLSHCTRIIANCGFNLPESMGTFFCSYLNSFYVESIYPNLSKYPRLAMKQLFSMEPNCTNYQFVPAQQPQPEPQPPQNQTQV